MYIRSLSRMKASLYVKYIALHKRWVRLHYKICTLPYLSSHDKALTQAVLCGNTHNVEMLLTRGANVNLVLPGGSPALFHAAANNCLNMAQVLINFGAEVNAAHIVTKNTALSEAASKGHVEVLDILISHGADVNAIGSSGTTPLMRAVLNKQVYAVKMLMDAGANKYIKSKRGTTAPLLAKALKHVELCQILGVTFAPTSEAENMLRPV